MTAEQQQLAQDLLAALMKGGAERPTALVLRVIKQFNASETLTTDFEATLSLLEIRFRNVALLATEQLASTENLRAQAAGDARHVYPPFAWTPTTGAVGERVAWLLAGLDALAASVTVGPPPPPPIESD